MRRLAYQGKHSAKREKRPAVGWIAAVLIVVLIAAVLIWSFAARDAAPKKVENSGQEVTAPDDVLQTPYGELTYPGLWTDKVAHETIEEGDTVQIVFRSTLKDAEVELFRLSYGAVPEGGFVLGQMADGAMVSVVMGSIEPDDAWPQETLDTLYALQESVNDLLVQLQAHPELTPQE
ncbi:MAG: hypothetical protein IJO88_07760 [Oscillospiraceae bacterium]|nr:hypothetical protein [Oscillospiraceae bacterium]